MKPDRDRLRSIIRASLAHYRGGRFSIEGEGGSQGMMFNAPDGSHSGSAEG